MGLWQWAYHRRRLTKRQLQAIAYAGMCGISLSANRHGLAIAIVMIAGVIVPPLWWRLSAQGWINFLGKLAGLMAKPRNIMPHQKG